MKKCFVLLVLLTISIHSYSQFEVGVKAGLSYSTVIHKSDTAGWSSFGYAPSFHVGGYGRLEVTEKITLGTEFLITDKGFTEKGSGALAKSHLLYVNVPFIVNFQVTKHFSLDVGPEVGLLVASWGKNSEFLSAVYTNRLDLGLVAGIQYDITPAVGITLRCEQGLSNIIGRDAASLQYRYIQGGDPLIAGQNIRDQGIVHRNRNFQISVSYALFYK